MSWNYRVVRKVHAPSAGSPEGEAELGVCEVYYRDGDGEELADVTNWSDALAATCETLDELRDELGHMLDALDKPILDEADLKAEMERRNSREP